MRVVEGEGGESTQRQRRRSGDLEGLKDALASLTPTQTQAHTDTRRMKRHTHTLSERDRGCDLGLAAP